jgi:hypothetical protein
VRLEGFKGREDCSMQAKSKLVRLSRCPCFGL